MKKFFIGLLTGIVSAAVTIAFIYAKSHGQTREAFNDVVEIKYDSKMRSLSKRAELTAKIAKVKRAEAKHEAFTETRNDTVNSFMSNFRTGG